MRLRLSAPVVLLFVLSTLFVTSCELLGDVFQTGVGVGIFIAVVIIVLIFFISRIGKRR